ncbi:MAG: hypothetical protein ACQESG_00450 [Nanobdellota archaeon]
MELLYLILIAIGVAILSALPLHIAASLLGGRSSILKVIVIHILFWVISAFLGGMFGPLSPLLLFILLIIIYKIAFNVGWIAALLIWVTQFIVLAIIVTILFLVGITIPFITFF